MFAKFGPDLERIEPCLVLSFETVSSRWKFEKVSNPPRHLTSDFLNDRTMMTLGRETVLLFGCDHQPGLSGMFHRARWPAWLFVLDGHCHST